MSRFCSLFFALSSERWVFCVDVLMFILSVGSCLNHSICKLKPEKKKMPFNKSRNKSIWKFTKKAIKQHDTMQILNSFEFLLKFLLYLLGSFFAWVDWNSNWHLVMLWIQNQLNSNCENTHFRSIHMHNDNAKRPFPMFDGFCWHAVELISIQIFVDHKFHQLIKCNPVELTNAQFSNFNANIKCVWN